MLQVGDYKTAQLNGTYIVNISTFNLESNQASLWATIYNPRIVFSCSSEMLPLVLIYLLFLV